MGNIKQTEEELKKQLEDQLLLLKILAESYDSGDVVVAKSIATTVRLLVHDTKLSHSLLEQLNLKVNKFYDTSSEPQENNSQNEIRVGSFCGLVGIAVGGKQTFIPYLDEVPDDKINYVDFKDYWDKIIFIDQNNVKFTRKEIILAVANQDGGAHVDPNIDEKYKKIARENSLGWITSNDGKIWNDCKGSELAAVRQIGHEILRTFLPSYPHKKMSAGENSIIMGGMGMWLGTTNPPDKITKIDTPEFPKVGRNEKCPCGKDLKYKKCHGR
jgi:hypothetical protein